MEQKTIYISGFDIFHKESYFICHNQKQVCSQYGFNSFHPFDKELTKDIVSQEELIKNIVRKNLEDIEKSDIIIANINSFRGAEPDSGTIFECGYAFAKGKIVIGYKKKLKSYVEEYIDELNVMPIIEDDLRYDKNGFLIDTFSNNFNIMIERNIIIVEGDFTDAVKKTYELTNNK